MSPRKWALFLYVPSIVNVERVPFWVVSVILSPTPRCLLFDHESLTIAPLPSSDWRVWFEPFFHSTW